MQMRRAKVWALDGPSFKAFIDNLALLCTNLCREALDYCKSVLLEREPSSSSFSRRSGPVEPPCKSQVSRG